MSIVFSNNKKKRSRSTSSEPNSSFVKNVASRVSGFLPVTITKWFSSPSSSNTNGSAPTADTTDSSTEEETTDIPIAIQPPQKRMRYSSPISLDHYVTTESTGNDIEKIDLSNKCKSVQSPPGRATFGRESNFSSTPLRTSSEEVLIERRERETNYIKLQHRLSSNYSVNTKRSSLFCNETMSSSNASLKTTGNSNTIIDPKQPCFKPNLLGSPFYPGRTVYGGATSSYINKPNIVQRKETIVNEMSSSDNTISHSAKRVMDLLEQYSSPLAEAKRIQHYMINSINDTFNSRKDSSRSNNTKTFSYKTQELQVPSIASILRLKQRSRLMNTTSVARQIIASHSSSSDVSPYPSSQTPRLQNEADVNQNLTTKMKSRLTRPKRGENSELQNQPAIVNFPSAALDIDKKNLPKFNLGTTPVSDSTSKCTISSSISEASSSTKVTVSSYSSSGGGFISIRDSRTINNITEKNNKSKQESAFDSNMFKFASPVRIINDSSTDSTLQSKFTFGSPERHIEQKTTNTHKDSGSSSVGTNEIFESKKITVLKSWKCDSCWVSNKEDDDVCVCCSFKKFGPNNPVQMDKAKVSNKCSVCKITDSQSYVDKCKNCEKVNFVNNSTLGNSSHQSKWSCQDCSVKNDDTTEKCICGGSKKPIVISNFGKDITKIMTNTSSEWKCEICWIKNKNDSESCAACGTNKPNSITASSNKSKDSNPLASSENILPNLNRQTDKWECPSCLVRNDKDKSKCVCCDTAKPGSVTESDKKLYNFGVNQNTTFKFGIDPKVQESVTSKKIENEALKNTKTIDEVSETNNNVLAKTPTFAFGIPVKKSEVQADNSKAKIKGNEVPTPSFSFGIPKAMPALIMTNPVPQTPYKLAETKLESDRKENLQEVPKITVSPKLNSPFPAAKTFESPFSSKTDKNVASPSFVLQPLSNAENKEALSNNQQQVQSSTITSVESPQVTFNVSAPENKLSSNFFSSAAPCTVSSAPFISPVQVTSVTTSPFQNSLPSPTTSSLFPNSLQATTTSTLFQNSSQTTTTSSPFHNSLPKTISSGSLFQKSDAPISIVSPLFTQTSKTNASSVLPTTASTTAPLFSFGNASRQPLADTPKFNFSFSTNKTESSPFKPNFGASDNNISSMTPKFSLSNTNPLGNSGSGAPRNLLSGSGLSGNTLPAPASQPTTSILGEGNALSNNPLVSNNNLSTGNALQTGTSNQQGIPSAGIFGATAQKEMWSPNNNTNSSNLFVTNASANSLAKPATFTFGSSTPFNNNAAPTFGSNAQPSNVFGIPNQNSLFSSPTPNQPMGTMFGSVTNNVPVSSNLFGSPNAVAPATFGAPSAPFESPSLPAAPASSFSFGAPQSTGVFGFGQHQPQQGSVYGVAGSPMNFNMGSHPSSHTSSVNGRRMKRAVRRQR